MPYVADRQICLRMVQQQSQPLPQPQPLWQPLFVPIPPQQNSSTRIRRIHTQHSFPLFHMMISHLTCHALCYLMTEEGRWKLDRKNIAKPRRKWMVIFP